MIYNSRLAEFLIEKAQTYCPKLLMLILTPVHATLFHEPFNSIPPFILPIPPCTNLVRTGLGVVVNILEVNIIRTAQSVVGTANSQLKYLPLCT